MQFRWHFLSPRPSTSHCVAGLCVTLEKWNILGKVVMALILMSSSHTLGQEYKPESMDFTFGSFIILAGPSHHTWATNHIIKWKRISSNLHRFLLEPVGLCYVKDWKLNEHYYLETWGADNTLTQRNWLSLEGLPIDGLSPADADTNEIFTKSSENHY